MPPTRTEPTAAARTTSATLTRQLNVPTAFAGAWLSKPAGTLETPTHVLMGHLLFTIWM